MLFVYGIIELGYLFKETLMEQLENYHYAGLLFTIAGITDGVNINRKIDGTGLSRKVYYNISTPDSKISYDYMLATYPSSKNPYKIELYELISHILKQKKINTSTTITNDDEMYNKAIYLLNEFIHMKNVKANFCFSQEQFDKTMEEVCKPFFTLDDWRRETEQNFIPYCREHILLTTAQKITELVCVKKDYTNKDELIKTINSALKSFGFNEQYISHMHEASKSMPIEPAGNQKQ